MTYQWNFSLIGQYSGLFLSGLEVTIAFTIVTIFLGLIMGLVIGALRLTSNKVVTVPLILLVGLFRCTPLLVILVWVYYALPVIIGVTLSPVVAGVVVLSLYVGAFYSEIFRGGIQAVDAGQWAAARALGLRTVPTLRLVILPQAIRHMIPPFINQSVTQWKNTAQVSVIAVPDLLYQGTLVAANTFRPLEVYTIIALIYISVLFPLTVLGEAVGRRIKAA